MDSAIWSKGNLGKRGAQPQVVFAQVREDAAIELEILRSRPAGETAFCIASGGCTALTLLLARPQKLHVIDVNPAQVFLVELKRAALLHLSYSQMLRTMTRDARPDYAPLRLHLSAAAQEFWDAHCDSLSHGLNGCGMIEKRLRQIMRWLPLIQSRRNIRRLFTAKTLGEQRRVYQKLWNHARWKAAFEILLSRPILKVVYGDQFMNAVPPRFARQIKWRMDEAFMRHLIGQNPYLWQTFQGIYPPHQNGLPFYLQSEDFPIVQSELPKMHLAIADAALYLEAQTPESVGFFALSNILKITSPAYSARLMRAVFRAAKPGAKVCLRSIFPFDETSMRQSFANSKLDFQWLPASDYENRDRSFFCVNIRVLQVAKGVLPA